MRAVAVALFCLYPQDDSKIAQWIRDLSDDAVEVRDRATEELVRLGRAVEKPLREAEKAGIKAPRTKASAPVATEDWEPSDGAGSLAELPVQLAGRAASLGRHAAEGGVRTARDVTEGAASAGLHVARRAIGAG